MGWNTSALSRFTVPVVHIAPIAMGRFYLIRTNYQPYERPLQMSVEQLHSVRDAIAHVNGRPGIHVFDDYIIYNSIPDRYFSYENMDPSAAPGDLRPA